MEGVRLVGDSWLGGDAQARIVEPSAEAPFETKRLEQAPAVSAMYANTRLRSCMKSEPSRYRDMNSKSKTALRRRTAAERS
jgi:hypothetical protein